MSKSTNTKDELELKINSLVHHALFVDETVAVKEILNMFAKQRQQLLQRIKKEVIGEDETPERPINDYHWRIRNELRQTQRETLETMEKQQ